MLMHLRGVYEQKYPDPKMKTLGVFLRRLHAAQSSFYRIVSCWERWIGQKMMDIDSVGAFHPPTLIVLHFFGIALGA